MRQDIRPAGTFQDSVGCLYHATKLLTFTELAVVIGDLVLVALRHLLAARTAHAARAVGFFHLARRFHFDLLDAAHQGGLYALGQQRIVGIGVGVEALHVADQVLQILDHGGIVALRLLLELAQGAWCLGVVVLEILGVHRLQPVARIAVAVPRAAARVAVIPAGAIASAAVGGSAALLHLAALLAATLLTALLAATLLALLPLLPLLALLTLLPLLTLLTLLALLPLSALALLPLLPLLALLTLLATLLSLLALLTLLPTL